MKNYPNRLLSRVAVVLGLLGSMSLAVPAIDAEAADIRPINMSRPLTMKPAPVQTIKIVDSAGVDITDSWLPEPGQSVTLQVRDAAGSVVANPSISLIAPPGGLTFPASYRVAAACSPTPCENAGINPFLDKANGVATTSAYPDICTNYPSRSPTSTGVVSPDLTADYQLTGATLTAKDCGGMAVVVVSGETYILPQDSDFDGIPDIYENTWPTVQAGGTTCTGLVANSANDGDKSLDTDCPTVTGGQVSDGIAALDEYRGFMVSPADPTALGVSRDANKIVTFFGGVLYTDGNNKVHKHIRTSPRSKDFFVHLVNPQCIAGVTPNQNPPPAPSLFTDSTASLLGGGASNYLPPDGTSLFGFVTNLISETQIHPLDYNKGGTNYTTDEWVDNFVSYAKSAASKDESPAFAFSYKTGTNTTISDRQINQWAIFPIEDSVTKKRIQKGVRVVECLHVSTDNTNTATVNEANTPTGLGGYGSANAVGLGYSIIFTKRIENRFLLASPCPPPATATICGLIARQQGKTLRYITWVNGAETTPATTYPKVNADGTTENRAIDAVYIVAKAIQFYTAMEIGHAVKLNDVSHQTYGYHTPMTGDNMDPSITNFTEPNDNPVTARSASCPAGTFAVGCNNFKIPSTYNSSDQQKFKLRN